MIHRRQSIVIFFIMAIIIAGCTARPKPVSIPGYAERGIRLIAVMPVKAETADPKLMMLMRERILDTLYFKGYPRVPLALIDEKLAIANVKSSGGGADVPPQAVRSLLGVDAVLYVTLDEFKTSTAWLYAATSLAGGLELRDGRTGETIWKARLQTVERSFDVTTQRLERTVYQVLEPAIQAEVEKTLQGLPEGPDAVQ